MQRMTGYQKVLTTSILVAAATAATAQDFGSVEIKIRPVSGNVSVIEGRGGNIGLFHGSDGVFLIDDQYAPLTDRIVAAIRDITDAPIRFLVNTHMHPDHTGGNENFGKLGTVIFGHDNVRTQMLAAEYQEAPPVVTFSDTVSFHINDELVHVFKVPDSHTNGDAYIKFEESNVIHTGDVYRTTTYPYIDTSNGGSYLGTIEALDVLIEACDDETKIIPGHGTISNAVEATAFRDMLVTIRDRVADSIANDMTLEEIQQAGLTSEFDDRWAGTGRIGGTDSLLAAAYADLTR